MGPALSFPAADSVQQMRPAQTTPDRLEPRRVSRAGCLVAAIALLLAAASGCSNIQSQAANVEGVRLYQQGNYAQASDRFQQAIAKNPKSPEGYYNLAASLHKSGTLYNRPADLQQAENLYNRWFMKPIPPRNVSMNLPMNYLLRDSWRYPSDVVAN